MAITDLEKMFFLWTLKIWELEFFRKSAKFTRERKKTWNCTRLRESNIKPICILFLSFGRCYIILSCYLHSIYLVFIYFALFPCYINYVFAFISRINAQRCTFGRKQIKFGKKYAQKLNSLEFMEFFLLLQIWWAMVFVMLELLLNI